MAFPDLRKPSLLSAARAGGEALAGVIRTVAAVRPAAKPLHPQGTVKRGVLVRRGLQPATGVPWLDEAGEDQVLLRWSRAVGLPAPAPDIHGLAVRVLQPDGNHGDLLFATTGWSWPSRVVLLPGFSSRRPMTTLLPYSTPQGGLVLGARPEQQRTTLYAATPLGTWREFGELWETGGPDVDEPVTFDPVVNYLPGLSYPGWVRQLREPAYLTARSTRDTSGDREDPR